uniref:Uncharacterized protein n=1 Tax=Leersia perrieri TaxID=77586 RepID=A0A0D9W9P8_9ORYZ
MDLHRLTTQIPVATKACELDVKRVLTNQDQRSIMPMGRQSTNLTSHGQLDKFLKRFTKEIV